MEKYSTTKDRILHKSAHLFARRGFSGVSMRDIAEDVDIKAASIYNHYQGKQEILQDIIDHYEIKRLRYNPKLEDFKNLSKTETVRTVLRRIHFAFDSDDESEMIDATAIIFRERYNHDFINRVYMLHFEEIPTKLVRDVYDMLVETRRMMPFNTKNVARFCTYASNALASDAISKLIAAYHGIQPEEPSMPISDISAFMYTLVERYVIPDN